jgi:tRNA G18 (ribose-2'-O)-methylase SpoU
MADFAQQRHQPVTPLSRPRELIVACPPMRSNVNLSRIARAAGSFGVQRMICCGTAKLITKIARDSSESIALEIHRTLPPVLTRLKQEGFTVVGLEQTTDSQCLFDFAFARKTVLVIGNERLGIQPEVLRLMDQTVEIPTYGQPDSHNAATTAAMGIYEYCRQFRDG